MKPSDLPWLIFAVTVPALTFATWVRLHYRLLVDLRTRHNLVWIDLGTPTLFQVILTQGRPGPGLYGGQLDYGTWLYWRTYRDLHDDAISRLGDQIQRLSWAGPLVVLGAWGAVALYVTRPWTSA